ncbi:LacI family DNA-binding transcriptional regulator [Kineosporia babensis]|uniref:LacI family transcriptional regulator n=1 Tax=Kineosporia babensis TaxID=499548 RepID=A0A9X1NNX6_9ACTN|nr:LacI family DNA-binding transcriptional regulator [Kineosporia babensis]MCD5316533.1 LacI family transcriptional regulator [Kineosporia babensis]
MATLGDVAARAGVSISSVSRVLSNHPAARISEATRRRIVEAAEELRYRPNFAGRALKSARTQVIGLVLPDLTNALSTDLMHGAEDEAREHGYTMLLGRSDALSPVSEVIARLIGEGRVDGMVLQLADGVPAAGIGDLLDTAAPVVLLNETHPGHVGSVALDDVTGARIATQHLIELGHERIAMVNGLPSSFTAQRRRTGYRTAMKAAGLRVPRGYETRLGYFAPDGRAALRRLMTLSPAPTAVVVANVNAAVGLLAEARQARIAVPRRLSVICVHDSWTAENTWPPLTAVQMQFYAMGRAAVRNVLDRIENGVLRDDVILDPPPQLIVRNSTARPPRATR